jgi:hypothetical protein
MAPERGDLCSAAVCDSLRNFLRLLGILVRKTPREDDRSIKDKVAQGLLSRSNSFIVTPPRENPCRFPKVARRRAAARDSSIDESWGKRSRNASKA